MYIYLSDSLNKSSSGSAPRKAPSLRHNLESNDGENSLVPYFYYRKVHLFFSLRSVPRISMNIVVGKGLNRYG